MLQLESGAARYLKATREGLKRPRRRSTAEWAAEQRHVSAESGSRYPGKWSNALTPHLVEPMECASLHHPARSVTFKKCHQAGFSEVGLNLIGHIVTDEPCTILVVLPTTDEVKKYVKTKLHPMIEATPAVCEKVMDQISRDETGSTTTFKRFRGGFVQLAGANASSGLKMITARVLIAEEVTEYPDDVDGQGDPLALAEKRLTTWEGYEKKLYISTPGTKGSCRITAKYDLSDQRKCYLPCPHCGAYQTLEWANLDKDAIEPEYPCASCGVYIEHRQLRIMLRGLVWLKTYPGTDDNPAPPKLIPAADIGRWRDRASHGRDPGFFFDALSSPLTSWRAIVKVWNEAKNDHAKEKDFTRQVLAEAWEEKGEAPDHVRLFEKRVAYDWRRIPPGALFVTVGADVQADRIEWAAYAWGAGFTSWLIDKGVLEGSTADAPIWLALDKILDRSWPDAYGREWKCDLFGIDSGYLSQRVYQWVARHAHTGRVRALDGRPGWRLPALGTPSKRDIDWEGKKIGAVLLWPVGTWGLKSELYAALAKMVKGRDLETGRFAPGTALYGEACDMIFFERLCAEQLRTRVAKNGLAEQIWEVIKGRRNEDHDIAVYARACAHSLADGMQLSDWQKLASFRQVHPEDIQRDLAALWSAPAVDGSQPGTSTLNPGADAPAVGAPPPSPPPAPSLHPRPHEGEREGVRGRRDEDGDDWLGSSGRDWLN